MMKPSEQDGYRVLVDRLWPRRHEAGIFEIRLLGKRGSHPSNDLRKWFHADIEKRWGTLQICIKKD